MNVEERGRGNEELEVRGGSRHQKIIEIFDRFMNN
jgi:hypothetical protein